MNQTCHWAPLSPFLSTDAQRLPPRPMAFSVVPLVLPGPNQRRQVSLDRARGQRRFSHGLETDPQVPICLVSPPILVLRLFSTLGAWPYCECPLLLIATMAPGVRTDCKQLCILRVVRSTFKHGHEGLEVSKFFLCSQPSTCH
jgi:hypothetical protein